MEIQELTEDETVVFVALLREVIKADNEYSDEERGAVTALSEVLGRERMTAAMKQAQARYSSRAELKDDAKAVGREAARDVIYRTLVGIAESDGVAESEDEPLHWLATWWGLAQS